jgi:hypothetical protein
LLGIDRGIEMNDFDLIATVGDWQVRIDSEGLEGEAENSETGQTAALGFEVDDNEALILTDFDGLPTLPAEIVEALREVCVHVDENFN